MKLSANPSRVLKIAALGVAAAGLAVPAAHARPAPPDPDGAQQGVRQCVVPDVHRFRLGVAKSVIFFSDCRVGKITRTRGAGRRGRVVSQSPAAGTVLSFGARVDLVVSKGGGY